MDENLLEGIARLKRALSERIVGNQEVIEEVLVCLFAGGHMLIESPPGLGKTYLARTVCELLELQFARVQATSDLTQSDVIGFCQHIGGYGTHFCKGPIFTNILLVDEVNRAQPKTQSVFLEAMEEKNITLANTIHTLPVPFFLIATQNPIEYDGTYPLPEAQQDRFLMKLNMTYLSVDDEKALMMRKRPSQTCKIMGRQEVAAAQHYAKYSVTADEGVVDHIVSIVSETRRRREALIGASTRCSLQYLQAAKAKAMLEGRDEVSPKDVTDLAHPILRHRIVMNQDCKSFGYSPDDLIDDILRKNKK